ncbi:MAG: hypothetical protein ACI94Y_001722 [Maribacter sp.]|jgi:hypothetical protein
MHHPKLNILSKITFVAFLWLASSAFTMKEDNMKNTATARYMASVELDDSGFSPHQKKMYEKDAVRLALRNIVKGGNYKSLGPDVPEEVRDELYNALVAVHKSPFGGSIEVTKKHRLHTYPNPAVDKFQVNYKNTSKWATPLRLGDNITSSKIINELSNKYDLTIDSHQTWDDKSNIFIVKAKTAINLAPIAEKFLKEVGVESVNMLIPSSDGNDIEAIKTIKGWRLDYKVKFDSCFTGCKKSHIWSFEIANIKNGSANVNFIGESGDKLPDWMK